MRKPNFELQKIKLQQKQLQLAQISKQLELLNSQVRTVTDRLEAKQGEVTFIEDLLNSAVSHYIFHYLILL